MPRVSVIIPNYNYARFLPAAIGNDTDRMETIKLVMTPDFLQGEMGWKYDAGAHVISVPF